MLNVANLFSKRVIAIFQSGFTDLDRRSCKRRGSLNSALFKRSASIKQLKRNRVRKPTLKLLMVVFAIFGEEPSKGNILFSNSFNN